jgi:16S rRNA (adenine1518-N6/adenine1519-N6)-dimethyltransferase
MRKNGNNRPGLRAKKSLGQNFLISPRVVERIAEAGSIKENESVLEIGPGKGVLTRALLRFGARVKAIEKDDRLIPLLASEFKAELASKKLELIHGDVLEMTPDEISALTGSEYKVIANIPYYITGSLIRNFLSAKNKPREMILMVQKEVASRMIARDKKESILSLSVRAFAVPELVMNVSRGNFFPEPNVDSAVIKLSNIRDPFESAQAEETFFKYVKAGFSQKRKKLISNLEAVEPKETLVKKFETLNIGENARAEDISLETWISLSRI